MSFRTNLKTLTPVHSFSVAHLKGSRIFWGSLRNYYRLHLFSMPTNTGWLVAHSNTLTMLWLMGAFCFSYNYKNLSTVSNTRHGNSVIFSPPMARSRHPHHPHLNIELLKLLQVENARGTVFEEAFVPLLQLCLVEFGALGQVIQNLWSELAVVLPHDALPVWRRERQCEHKWAAARQTTATALMSLGRCLSSGLCGERQPTFTWIKLLCFCVVKES